MRFPSFAFIAASAVAAGALHAQTFGPDDSTRSVELSLSNKAGELRYSTPTTVGGRNTEASYALFLSEDRDLVGSAGLLFDTDLDFGPLQLRLGPQAYAALLNQQNEDVFAIAIGASARFDLVKSRGIAIVGKAYWSPDILTFGSANNLTDLMARAEIRLGDRITGFGGYRWFRVDLTVPGRRNLQNQLFAGVRYQLQ